MSSKANVNGGNPPSFLDDNERTAGANGQPAVASLMAKEIALANQLAHAGRPVFSWYGANGQTQPPSLDHTSAYRQIYMAGNAGAVSEAGLMMGMHHDEASPPGFQSGQGYRVRIGGVDTTTLTSDSSSAATTWPSGVTTFLVNSSFGVSTTPTELTIGAVTSNYPQPKAGTYWQNPNNLVDMTSSSYIGSQDVHAGGDIVAVKSGTQENLSKLAAIFNDTWFHQRPQIGWSVICPGQFSSSRRAIVFNVSSQQYRYIFDQTYGITGTAFSSGVPGITLPLANSAAGSRTAVRVYVFVYAAMSGGTNTGTLAVSNKTAHNAVAAAPVALTNPVSITGSTFAWYPDPTTWTPTTGAYFNGFTTDAFDRIALCAKSSGPADQVAIGAFTFIVAPATS
jgi:hypothetical protein